jgi:hypothetical protein
MSGCHEVRPLLPARPEELTPEQALLRADHVLACNRCAAEAAGYSRLGAALAVLAGFEAEPPYGTLERILATLGRRRVAVALLGAILVAHALRQRRRATANGKGPGHGRPLGLPLVAAVRAR